MDPGSIAAIIEQYKRHDWELRRVLMSGESDLELPEEYSGVEAENSDQDALWFSRKSRPDAESWELRRLTNTPFALVAFIPNTADSEEREEILAQTEARMREAG
jgi:hypothetical protein